jgi:hypothetical protein
MPEIELFEYNSVIDYKNNKMTSSRLLNISVANLIGYAIDNGVYNGYSPKPLGLIFYGSIVPFALNFYKNSFVRGCDYENAEQSYKTSASFFLGMLSARAYFEKVIIEKYPGSILIHLSDNSVAYINGRNKTKPDFIILDCNRKPVGLLEAKGTFYNRVNFKTVNHANNQLTNISTITIKGRKSPSSSFLMEKHVITSSFVYDKMSKKHHWVLCDIDPNEVGETELVIDLDKAIEEHYSNIMNIMNIMTKYQRIQNIEIKNNEYLTVSVDGFFSLGILTKLYEILSDRSHEDLANSVFEVLKNTQDDYNLEENISLRSDGIYIEVDNEKKNEIIPYYIE